MWDAEEPTDMRNNERNSGALNLGCEFYKIIDINLCFNKEMINSFMGDSLVSPHNARIPESIVPVKNSQ